MYGRVRTLTVLLNVLVTPSRLSGGALSWQQTLQDVEHVPQDVRETFCTQVPTANGVEDRDMPEDARYEIIILQWTRTCSNLALSPGEGSAVLNRVGCNM